MSTATNCERRSGVQQDIAGPVAGGGFGDPEGFGNADKRWIGGPDDGVVRVENVLLTVAVEEMDDIAIRDWEIQVGVQSASLRDEGAANGKAARDGDGKVALHDVAHEAEGL